MTVYCVYGERYKLASNKHYYKLWTRTTTTNSTIDDKFVRHTNVTDTHRLSLSQNWLNKLVLTRTFNSLFSINPANRLFCACSETAASVYGSTVEKLYVQNSKCLAISCLGFSVPPATTVDAVRAHQQRSAHRRRVCAADAA